MKVVSVVGARPQFVKAAPLSRAIRARHHEVLVHTGQHYDDNMSAVFFRELGIPDPEHHLGVGSGTHGAQTGRMLEAIERVLLIERPDWLLIYGDTNSTVAGALAAAKLHLPVAHVEAGLRSFNRTMPEEVNRVVADHLSTLLLCPGGVARDNLAREGIVRGVEVVGDVMADALAAAVGRAACGSEALARFGLQAGAYALATVHRAENTDDPERLRAILGALGSVGRPVLMPLHPRTRKAIAALGITLPGPVRAIEPLGYLDLVRVASSAAVILTDSGGLQKEAYWLKVPCVTLREETEWVETVESGWNVLAGAVPSRIVAAASAQRPPAWTPLYGDGDAATQILEAMERAC